MIYVVFTNISVGAGGVITFTYTGNANVQGNYGVNHEGDFNGLQLINTTLVNFDVAGGEATVNGQVPTNYTGQAAFSSPGNNYWNPIVPNGTTKPGTNADGSSVSAVTPFTEAQSWQLWRRRRWRNDRARPRRWSICSLMPTITRLERAY